MYCQQCGKEVQENATVCMSCGCAVNNAHTTFAGGYNNTVSPTVNVGAGDKKIDPKTGLEISPKKGVVALILIFFLGQLGIHRFYVGKIGSGIVMLLLFLAWYIPVMTFYVNMVVNTAEYGQYYEPQLSDFSGVMFASIILIGWVVWWIVDLIMICMSRFKDKQGRIVKL